MKKPLFIGKRGFSFRIIMKYKMIKYNICIGDVPLLLHTPFDIFWKKEDLQFISGDTDYPLKIYLQEVNTLPSYNGMPVYNNRDMFVYETTQEQLRYFRRNEKKTPYLCSIYNKNKINVLIPKHKAGNVEIRYNIWDYIFLEKNIVECRRVNFTLFLYRISR